MKHDSNILKRIKNYFMHRKSAEEAYAFEREIERDPFLYDTIEGFEDMLTSEIQQALDELDDQIDERSKKRGFVFTWQAAAISGVIVVGASLFAILGQRNTNESVSPAVVETEQSDDRAYTPRTNSVEFSSMDEVPLPLEEDSTLKDEVIAMSEPPPMRAINERDQTSEPINQTKEAVPEDTPIAAVEMEAKPAAMNDDAEMADTMGEVAFAAEETTIRSSEDVARKVSTISSDAPQKSLGMSATKAKSEAAAPTPAGGMASYQRYLKRSIQRTPGMPNGVVVLSFEFDRDGKPRKVEVMKSLCTACDLEAQRAVEEGPAWEVGDRKERVSLEVPF